MINVRICVRQRCRTSSGAGSGEPNPRHLRLSEASSVAGGQGAVPPAAATPWQVWSGCQTPDPGADAARFVDVGPARARFTCEIRV